MSATTGEPLVEIEHLKV
jgi:peptide/nickel transport system ATP-binding protein